MIGNKKTPRIILETAYQIALQRCLTDIFRKTPALANRIVEEWWQGIARTRVARSGLYLHDEPIETAADLIGLEYEGLNEKNMVKYREILHHSLDSARIQKERSAEEPSSIMKALQPIRFFETSQLIATSKKKKLALRA